MTPEQLSALMEWVRAEIRANACKADSSDERRAYQRENELLELFEEQP